MLPKWYDAAAEEERHHLFNATTGFRLPYATAAGINRLQYAVITGGRKCAAGRFCYLLHAAIGKQSPIQEGSDKIIDQLHQFPSNAEDMDFGVKIPE